MIDACAESSVQLGRLAPNDVPKDGTSLPRAVGNEVRLHGQREDLVHGVDDGVHHDRLIKDQRGAGPPAAEGDLRQRDVRTRLRLGAPGIFAGAPSSAAPAARRALTAVRGERLLDHDCGPGVLPVGAGVGTLHFVITFFAP